MSASRPFTHAFVRKISRSLADCELTHLSRQPFDLSLANRQHDYYIEALQRAGLIVKILPEEPRLPDSSFVEDPVLMLEEGAVLCRLGAPSRALEAELLQREIAELRSVFKIEGPGTLEGGDILRVDQTLFVGRSGRTNADGVAQLRHIVEPWAYRVVEVTVHGCLHLKTAVTSPAPGLLVANSRWVDLAPFDGFEILPVPEGEPWGANTLRLHNRVLVAASAPETAMILRAKGLMVEPVDVSELQKAEAGLTCMSVLYSQTSRSNKLKPGQCT